MSLSSAGKYEVGNPAPSIRHQMGPRGDPIGFVVRSPLASGGVEGTHPFKATKKKVGGTWQITLEPGYVQNFSILTPTIGGTPMTTVPHPTFSAPSEDFIIYLTIVIDTNGHGVSAALTCAPISDNPDTGGLPEPDATHGYCAIVFGYWVDDDEDEDTPLVLQLEQVVSFSLGHQKCGTITQNFWAM